MLHLRRLLHEREALITIGVFGLMQMMADFFADWGLTTISASCRAVGFGLVLTLLLLGLKRRTAPLNVPLCFGEQESRQELLATLDRFVISTGLSKAVREINQLSPVDRAELAIRLSPDVRNSRNRDTWQEAFTRLLAEWEKEVDDRLHRWLPGVHSGIVYHIRPGVVLPLAFALGYAVGLRRSVVLYHSSPTGEFYCVMNLTHPRVLFENPPPSQTYAFQQVPPDLIPPEQGRERLILHFVVSDHHQPALNAHPEHEHATSVAIYLPQALPRNHDWLPCAQMIWRLASPWVQAFRQVDICLAVPDALAFALGMTFARTPHLRVCHWFGEQYLPVLDLQRLATRPPFD